MASHPASADRRLFDRFKLLDKIGEGTYGTVYRARDLSVSAADNHSLLDESCVALKKMRMDAQDEGVPVTTLREVALLKDLQHENIVRLRDVIPRPPVLYLVFDYVCTFASSGTFGP